MKKILLACGVLVMFSAVTGCGKKSASKENMTFGDSLSVAFGTSQGAEFQKYMTTLDEEQRAKINNDDILAGIKASLLCDTAKAGYSMGLNVGLSYLQQIQQIEQQTGVKMDRELLYQAFEEAMNNKSIDYDKVNAVTDSFFTELRSKAIPFQEQQRQKQMEEMKKAQEQAAKEGEVNAANGKKYVDDLKKKDASIKTTESGLSYKVLKEGKGAKVGANETVKVIYTGKLTDGTVFDSSEGKSVPFTASNMIPGFSEGMQLMTKGSKYILYIPGELAYGTNGIPGTIPPMSTLIFEVEIEE